MSFSSAALKQAWAEGVAWHAVLVRDDGVVHALLQPGLLQPLEKPLPAVIQRAVFAVLGDADDGHVLGAGFAGGERSGKPQAQGGSDYFLKNILFHGIDLLFALNF